MKYLILVFLCLSIFLEAQVVDSIQLSKMSLAELDSLFKAQKKAEELLPYALAMLRKGKIELDIQDTAFAKILYKVGSCYQNLSDMENATSHLEMAIKIWENKNPKNILHIKCLNSLGTIYYYDGKYEKTKENWLMANNICKEFFGEDHIEYPNTLNNLGVLYKDIGEYKIAEFYHKKAIEISKKIFGVLHPDYSSSLHNLGLLYSDIGEYKLAEFFYKQSLEVDKKILGEINPDYANTLNNLGTLYNDLGEYKLAESYLKKAIEILEIVYGIQHPEYSKILNNLGNLYSDLGDYKSSEFYYKQCLDIISKVYGEEHIAFSIISINYGILYSKMGDYKSAEKYFTQSLGIEKKVFGDEHPNYAIGLFNLGELNAITGNYQLAESYHLKALTIRSKYLGDEHQHCASSLMSLGALYSYKGDYQTAKNYFLQAVAINKKAFGEKHPDYAMSLNSLGILYKDMADYPNTESNYRQCYTIKNHYISTNFSWLTEKGKAAYWQQEKGFYGELNNFTALAAESYPQSTELSFNSNLIAKGLILESSKEIEVAVQNSKDSLTYRVFEELRDMRRLINHLVSTGTGKKEILDRYEQEADSLDKILLGRLGEYAASKRKFQITWKDVQNALAEKDAAIEFARYYNEKDSQHYYMALVLRQGYTYPKLAKLGAEKSILAAATDFNFPELYKLVWEPLDSFLNGVETVYYSPDGYLNNIAFSALCGNGSITTSSSSDVASRGAIRKKTKQTKDCVYLSDRYSLQQISTTRYLAEGLKSSNMENSILLFGGVNYDEIPRAKDTLAEDRTDMEDYALSENIVRNSANQNRMEYLPGTKTELQSLQKILNKKQWKIRAYSDENASENNFKTEVQIESPGILHVATHGFAYPDIQEKKKGLGEESKTYRDADNPMVRCGLMLAGSNNSWAAKPDTMLSKTGEDGILTALEVSQLNLRKTKLVVLSACETGLGKIEGLEGTFGLKRGFKLAGVEQIIVSLWSVPDKETMELMTLFYNDLSITLNPVTSFEKAQKEMRKKYPTEPEKWAGFVLVR